MSILIMSQVWKWSEATGGSRLVLLAVADCANDDGWAWPSIGHLAGKAKISESTTHRAVKALVRSGELEVHEKAGPSGTNLYRVVVDGGVKMAPSQNEGEGGSNLGGRGVSPLTPKPSLNHQGTPNQPDVPDIAAGTPPRGARIPEDFQVSFMMREWAKVNAPHVDLDKATEEFMDYWRGVPGQRGRKLDWPATWRNSMRHAEERQARSRGGTVPPGRAGAYASIPGNEWMGR